MTDSDSSYYRILREASSPIWLRKSERDSYANLAKRLGIDDQTVRTALKRMRQSGFLKTWTVMLNPHLFGMFCESVLLRREGAALQVSRDKIIAQLKLVEGVVLIFSFLDDPGFRILFYLEDERSLDRKIRLLSSICGVDKPDAAWEVVFPRCKMKVKETDWEIARALLQDSRMNVFEMAHTIGVSNRTVRRRLTMMSEENTFFPNPIVDLRKVEGFLYLFIVLYNNRKDKAVTDALLKESQEKIVFIDTTGEYFTVISALCQNISESRRLSDWIKTMDGVKQVIVRVMEELIPVNDWVDDMIKRRLSA